MLVDLQREGAPAESPLNCMQLNGTPERSDKADTVYPRYRIKVGIVGLIYAIQTGWHRGLTRP